MWIRVALNKNDLQNGSSPEYTSIKGNNIKAFYFDDITARALEEDGFLTEMWSKLDALFDWGDCDYFTPEKSLKFRDWLEERLSRPIDSRLRQAYKAMLELANLAIKQNTGISFDF